MDKQFKPRIVRIEEALESRYSAGIRPLSWDDRRAGFDKVRTADGEELTLLSGGQQSTPQPGWEILLTAEEAVDATELNIPSERGKIACYAWTLYGLGTPHREGHREGHGESHGVNGTQN
ncbi:hypothetical protein EBR25_00020 [bacterium]|nr:hypothetical protein [bacterium]